jgi:hypothetical protein
MVGFLSQFQKLIIRGVNTISGKAAALRRVRKPVSPLADRLLADALRLAEIPSPSPLEGERAAFVMDRFSVLGMAPWRDEGGNLFVRLHSAQALDKPPLLLFADLGSKRWHPLESLGRLDSRHAWGAGLADVLGAAALLSVAEGVASGRLRNDRDILLLFAARSFDDPESSFLSVTESREDRPFAAVGIRGFLLGSVITQARGTYRMDISVAADRGEKETDEEPEPPKKAPKPSNVVVDALISTAHTLSEIWGSDESIRFYIRRIEAGTGFGRTPLEGVLEIELESSDGVQLDKAMNRVKAVVWGTAQSPELRTSVNITSFIPAGDPSVNAELSRALKGIMKELHIKIQEGDGADPSAFLSNHGIPSVSLGIAHGWEGLIRDTIEISSIEKGRQLVENFLGQIMKNPAASGGVSSLDREFIIPAGPLPRQDAGYGPRPSNETGRLRS